MAKHKRVKINREANTTAVWCYVDPFGDDERTLCQGLVWWEDHDHDNAPVEEFTNNWSKKITCPDCKKIIKHFKSM